MLPKHPAAAICGALMLVALAACKVDPVGESTGDDQPTLLSARARSGPGPYSQRPLYLLANDRDPKDRYMVIATSAPFFIKDPTQPHGADFNLHKGDSVMMVQREFAYSRVRAGNGREGFVATDQLKPVVPLAGEDIAPPGLPPTFEPSGPLEMPTLQEMISPGESPLPSGGAQPQPTPKM